MSDHPSAYIPQRGMVQRSPKQRAGSCLFVHSLIWSCTEGPETLLVRDSHKVQLSLLKAFCQGFNFIIALVDNDGATVVVFVAFSKLRAT